MNYLRDIFEGDQDKDYIHQRFIKYGRGTHNGPTLTLKKTKQGIKINATYGFENILGYILLQSCKDPVNVNGNIISPGEIGDNLALLGIEAKKTRKKRSTYIYKLTDKYKPETLLQAYNEFPSNIFLLNLSSGRYNLKTKNNTPKPGSNPDEKFCSATYPPESMQQLLDEICFGEQLDKPKEITVRYRYTINGFITPEEYKNNPQKMRIYAKRTGVAKRSILHKGVEGILETEIKV